jgi:hypothetical protein
MEWTGCMIQGRFLSWGLSTPVDTFLIASYFPRVPIIIVFTYLLSLTTSSDPHVLLVIVAAGAPNFESQSSLALPRRHLSELKCASTAVTT